MARPAIPEDRNLQVSEWEQSDEAISRAASEIASLRSQ